MWQKTTSLAVAILAIALAAGFFGCEQQESPVGMVNSDQTGGNWQNGDSLWIGEGGRTVCRLSPNPREAIKLEAFYALNTSHNGGSTKQIGGYAVSDWNYIYSDLNAYNVEKARYGSDASGFSSYYNNIQSYGLSPGGYGRGGQCRHFTDLILYRSGTYQVGLPTYQQVINDYNGPRNYTKLAGQVYVGDLIQTKWASGHTAVVVAILAGTPGVNVTCADVVDANWIGGGGNEIIGRHYFNTAPQGGITDLDSYIGIDVLDLGAQ